MSPELLDQAFVERIVAAFIFAIGGRMFWRRHMFIALSCSILAVLAAAAAIWRIAERAF